MSRKRQWRPLASWPKSDAGRPSASQGGKAFLRLTVSPSSGPRSGFGDDASVKPSMFAAEYIKSKTSVHAEQIPQTDEGGVASVRFLAIASDSRCRERGGLFWK